MRHWRAISVASILVVSALSIGHLSRAEEPPAAKPSEAQNELQKQVDLAQKMLDDRSHYSRTEMQQMLDALINAREAFKRAKIETPPLSNMQRLDLLRKMSRELTIPPDWVQSEINGRIVYIVPL